MSKAAHPLTIYFVIGGMPFDGDTIKHSSLGGSETAAVCVARELAAMGHYVVVFSHLPADPAIFDGVQYAPVEEAVEAVQKVPHDVLMVQRNPGLFGMNTASKFNFLWNHDLAMREMAALHNAALWNMDGIFLLSDYHIAQYKETYPFIPHKTYVKTRNGIDLELFPKDVDKVPKKVMYGARPERGLVNLLGEKGIMETLWEMDPEIHLYLVGYYNPVQHFRDFYQYLAERAELLPNVTDLGHLPKHELYRHYAEAELYLYPTPHPGSPFNEISCIGAMECMAAGTPFVTTARGALPETLGQGTSILLDIWPDHPHYLKQFSQTVHHLLNEGREDMERMAQAGKKRARDYTWRGVAKKWNKIFAKKFRQASKDVDRLVHHFRYHEDVLVARRLAEKHRKKQVVAEIDREYGWAFDEEKHRKKYVEFAEAEWKDRPEDHVGRHYDQVFQNEIRWDATKKWLEAMGVKPGAKILDVGCGCGYFSVGLANLGYHVTGYDVAPEYVRQAELLREQRFQYDLDGSVVFYDHNDDGWKLPGHVVDGVKYDQIGAASYDVIYIAEILEHLAYIEPQEFVAQFENFLKPDGHIVITTPFGPLRRVARKGSGMHHEFHMRHLQRMDIEEIFGAKEDFTAWHHFWQHTETTKEACGWWLYSFKAGGEYGQLNFHRKITVQNPRNRLSVCLITKNEEANLRKCLNSVWEIADEIVVCDTGSIDRTKEIAAEFGAVIIDGPNPLDPEQGFEAARNASIKPATGDWILWLDADEEMQDAYNLVKYLRHGSAYDAFRIRQHHFTCQPIGGYKIDRPSRVFRNKKGIRFFGIIHEHPEYAVNEGPGPAIELSDVEIAHAGYYTEPKRRAKFWRNLPLLEADRRAYPERVLGKFLYMRDLLHLAQWELETNGGQPTKRAQAFCSEAVQIYQNNFIAAGGHMMNDGLEYYSAGLKLLGLGQEYTWAMAVGDGHPQQVRKARFFNKDDYMAFMAKTVEEEGGV